VKTIDCEFCDREVTPTSGNQRTCLSRECRLKLRSVNRKKKRREDRKKNPKQCIWCLQPITEIGKRKYHPECKALKNAERVAEYNRTHKPTPGPKKPRKYKGRVRCRYCKKSVKRTGARQLTCLARECKNARKAELKRNARGLEERMRRAHEAKVAAHKKTIFEREHYRVGMTLAPEAIVSRATG
jgi:hypothetical protein